MGAFDKTKPAGSQKLRLADDEIRSNWDGLEDGIGRDHKFPSGYGTDAGEHAKVTFNAPIATPANVANKGFLYVKDVSAKAELHFEDEDANEIQLTSAGGINTIPSIPSGTVMLFGQSSAPSGWTRKSNWQDNSMLCYAATGDIGSGGSVSPIDAHTHTGPSHTHSGPSHTHSGPSHTHAGPSHNHQWFNYTNTTSGDQTYSTNGNSVSLPVESKVESDGKHIELADTGFGGTSSALGDAYTSNASGTTSSAGTGVTGAAGTGSTGAGGTGATGSNSAPYYQQLIAAVKD